MSCWLEAKIRYFFNLVKGTEQKYFLKFQNFDLKGHKESNWTNKRVKFGPKNGKNVSIDLEVKTMPLFHLIKSLEHCLFIKFPNFALGGSK